MNLSSFAAVVSVQTPPRQKTIHRISEKQNNAESKTVSIVERA